MLWRASTFRSEDGADRGNKIDSTFNSESSSTPFWRSTSSGSMGFSATGRPRGFASRLFGFASCTRMPECFRKSTTSEQKQAGNRSATGSHSSLVHGFVEDVEWAESFSGRQLKSWHHGGGV